MPQPVAIQFLVGIWFGGGKHTVPMFLAGRSFSSRMRRAKSLTKDPFWYCGCRTTTDTFTIWKGKGSSSIPSFHSPPLIKISLVSILETNCLLLD